MIWRWKGPLEGGITQSLIGKFLENPFTFVLYYGLGLEEPSQLNQNLLWGNVFHKGLEIGLKRPEPIKDIISEIIPHLKEEAAKTSYIDITTVYSVTEMLKLYPDSFKYSLNNIETEKQFKIKHNTGSNLVSLMGKMDLVAEKKPVYSTTTFTEGIHHKVIQVGNDLIQLGDQISSTSFVLGEHKSKGSYDKALFRQEVYNDHQLNIYLHCNNIREVLYDNVMIPESQWNCPPRDSMEKHEYYIKRLYHGKEYGSYPVASKSFAWLDCGIPFTFRDEQVSNFMIQTVNPIIDQICELYDYCCSSNFDPFALSSYNRLYYRKPLRVFDPSRTEKFKCNYHNFLTNKIDQSGLVETQEIFKELKGEG